MEKQRWQKRRIEKIKEGKELEERRRRREKR
jgi:hypothetical protein